MTSQSPSRRFITTFVQNVAAIFTLTVSSLAGAQAVPTIGTGGPEENSKAPYRGTSVSYGHAATALTFTPAAAPYYNPTYSHRIGIMPEWHFTKDFHLRGRFFLSQELTLSDETRYPHEVELSDLWIDAVYGGYKEKITGIRAAGDIRLTLPTSKTSQALTRLFTLAPSINLSRSFNVLSGLTLVYSTRFTYRFNRMATQQNLGPSIAACDINNCPDLYSTGRRNSLFDLLHGPTVVFNPHSKVSLSSTFLMQRAWLAPLAAPPAEFANIPELQNPSGPAARDAMAFALSATYQPWDLVSFTLGSFTFSSALGTNGLYEFPLFNRNTVVSLDATFDLEAAVTSLSPKEKK